MNTLIQSSIKWWLNIHGASMSLEGIKALSLRALVQLSAERTVWNKLNKPEQKIKSLSKLSFFTLQGSRKVILRDWDLPSATATLHSISGSFILYLELLHRYFHPVWFKLNVLMSFTRLLIWFGDVKWSSVSIYIVTQADIWASHCQGKSPFTSSLSLKFIAPLKCVHTRALVAGRSDMLTVLFARVRVSVSLDWHLFEPIINGSIIDVHVKVRSVCNAC